MLSQEYDLDARALYLKLAEGTVHRTRAVDDRTNVDLDASGKILGIEVLSPGSSWPLTGILAQYEIGEEDTEMR